MSFIHKSLLLNQKEAATHDLKEKEENTVNIEMNKVEVTNNKTKNNYRKMYPLPDVSYENNDSEIYLTVNIEGAVRKCLLDTGAQKCVLGKDAVDIWEKVKGKEVLKKINIRTAGNECHPGEIKKLDVSFDGTKKSIQFIYSPTITVPIALGMNFCNAWNIKLMRLRNDDKNLLEIGESEDDENEEADVEEVEHTLSKSEQKSFSNIMSQFNFSNGETIGCQNILKHKIDTIDSDPIFCLPYRYNPKLTQKIRQNIDRWLSLNIIENSTSNWRLPIVVVTKKDGSIRLCLDARKLNAITKRDIHTPPNVLHKLDSLPQNIKYFVRLDLNEAFLQTELEPEDRFKTAFSVPGIGEYQFVRMPFGLTNSPATQSRLMERIFGNKLEPYVMHYLDDVIVMGHSFEHLLENLSAVAKILNANNLTVSKKKTSNVLARIRILGHIVDEKGVHTDQRKIKSIIKWKKPNTGKELQRFLGFVNWYRRFIKNYAELSCPLYEISKKHKIEKHWDERMEQSFENLKKAMTSTPVLKTPDWNRKFIIQADASDLGTGAVLSQLDDENNEYVIEYYSYKFNKCEKKYSPTEKEMLAVLKAVRHFKYYIDCSEIEIYSDHYALQYLLNMKVLSGRLTRWILELQPFVNKIIHRAGKQMVVPDALSRLRTNAADEIQNTSGTDDYEWFDDFVQELTENADNYPQYHVEDGRIFKKVPWQRNLLDDDRREFPHPSLWKELIKNSHETTAHAGIKGTQYELKKWYWWPNMIYDIKNHIKACGKCASVKNPNYLTRAPLGKFRVPNDTMKSLSIDIKGSLPIAGAHKYKYIITVMDLLSRYGWARKIPNVTSKKIVDFLKDIFQEQNTKPKEIYHDNGSVFISKEMQEFLSMNNIKSKPTAVYHPQANTVERMNKSLTEAIRLEMCDDPFRQNRWASRLQEIMNKLNNRMNVVTQFTPYEVHYGYRPHETNLKSNPDHEERHRLIKKLAYKRSIIRYLQNSRQFSERSLLREFKIGEIVMIKLPHLSNMSTNISSKLFPPWEPAKIVEKCESFAYNVRKQDGKTLKINLSLIKGISPELQNNIAYLFDID